MLKMQVISQSVFRTLSFPNHLGPDYHLNKYSYLKKPLLVELLDCWSRFEFLAAWLSIPHSDKRHFQRSWLPFMIPQKVQAVT